MRFVLGLLAVAELWTAGFLVVWGYFVLSDPRSEARRLAKIPQPERIRGWWALIAGCLGLAPWAAISIRALVKAESSFWLALGLLGGGGWVLTVTIGTIRRQMTVRRRRP